MAAIGFRARAGERVDQLVVRMRELLCDDVGGAEIEIAAVEVGDVAAGFIYDQRARPLRCPMP